MANVSIPEVEPGDSEALVSALQNAALFARVGDDEETLHWLQRAAECAGSSGDDRRMLALARVVADFSQALREASQASQSAPKAPAQARRSRPPAPSARPATPNARTATPAKLPPMSATRRPPLPRNVEATPPTPAVYERTPPAPSVNQSAPIAVRMPSVSRSPGKGTASHVPATPVRLAKPVNGPKAEPVTTHLRQAARVSVVASLTEPGTFTVRLLPDGASAPDGAFEALLIAAHAGDAPFSATPDPPSSEPLTPPLRKAPGAR